MTYSLIKKIQDTSTPTYWHIPSMLGCGGVLAISLMLTGCGSDSDSTSIITDPIDGPVNTEEGYDDKGLPTVATGNFAIAVLPDTQKYAENSEERMYAQTQWIADNYKSRNIKFTTHLGDIVETTFVENEDGSISPNTAEWEVASKAMGLLDVNPETPYSISAGNHDVYLRGGNEPYEWALDINRIQANQDLGIFTPPYLDYFSASKQKSHFDTFQGTDPTGFNSYHIFSDDDGQQYLVMALDWRASDQTLEWANDVLQDHADIPTIITTHQLMNIDGDGVTAIFTPHGAHLWDNLIKNNDQIFLTLNGHHHGEAVKKATNNFGHTVYMVVVDYQSGFWGGNGMMQMIEFDKNNNELDFESFSPFVADMPVDERQPQDQLRRWKFSLPLDFDTRFSDLNKATFTDAEGNIQDTVAYWIFDENHQITNSQDGFEFIDLSGHGNSMALTQHKTDKSVDELFEVSEDAPSFGYAKGSANFKGNTVAEEGALLHTMATIPEDGKLDDFTLEAIIKVNPEWTPDVNAWSGVFTHVPSELQVCINYNLDCGGGDTSGGIFTSSLMELQFFGVASNGDVSSNWSWEINKDYWYHVVIVNEGDYNTMYVDGSKVMRTHKTEQPDWYTLPDGEWAVGVSSWDGNYDKFFNGKVAEVRLTERALDRSEWLNNHMQ